MIHPVVSGREHESGTPFAVGEVNSEWGYMHLFDDTSLDIVLEKLDTANDFVDYLRKKEAFIRSGQLIAAAGEEELLAQYLSRLGSDGTHDFVYPPNARIVIDEGHWERFLRSPERRAQSQADEISYAWDELIERFAHHISTDTLHYSLTESFADSECNLRWLARENRTRRRLLAISIHELIAQTPSDQMATRVVCPSASGDPFYVFLIAPSAWGGQHYRELRREWLYKYCMATKLRFPEASWVVGLATESGWAAVRSEDLFGLDCSAWSAEMQAEAEAMQAEFPVLQKVKGFRSRIEEYPTKPYEVPKASHRRKIGRNERCPCGSGQKYKRCCGK
jgi:hypothetical protein